MKNNKNKYHFFNPIFNVKNLIKNSLNVNIMGVHQ